MKRVLFLSLGVLMVSLFCGSDIRKVEAEDLNTMQKESVKPNDIVSAAVSVSGQGKDKETALINAFRRAVEGVAGVYVYSKTVVEKYNIIRDDILTNSRGYIRDYTITSEKKLDDGSIIVSVTVSVDNKGIQTLFRDAKITMPDTIIGDIAVITQKQERLKKSAELLKAVTGKKITQKYFFNYLGYTITDIGLEDIKGNYHINVTQNPAYWQLYEEVLKQIQEDPSDKTLMEVIEYDDKDLKLPHGNGYDNYDFLTSRFPYSITYGLFSGSKLVPNPPYITKDKKNIRLYISYEYFISKRTSKTLNFMTTPENYLSGRFYNINRHLCEFTEKPFYCRITSEPNPKPDDPPSWWEGKLVLFKNLINPRTYLCFNTSTFDVPFTVKDIKEINKNKILITELTESTVFQKSTPIKLFSDEDNIR